MMDYSSFCYLQNQKTGCTFVEYFLRQFSNQPLKYYRKHAAVNWWNYDENKFYFINVREPTQLYWSLFSYGLDQRGEIFDRLRDKGLFSLYQNGPSGFERWASFVLDATNSSLLNPNYTREIAEQFGFMTWRFLRLSCYAFEEIAKSYDHRKTKNIANKLIVRRVLHQENLRNELSSLVKGELEPFIKDIDAALLWIDNQPRINSSSTILGGEINPSIKNTIKNKEEYLYERYYQNS